MEGATKPQKRTAAGQTGPVSDSDRYSVGAAGILRYRREPSHTTSSAAVHPGGSSTEYSANCEYCGQDAKPLLELSWEQWPENATAFCCVQRQQLYQLLEEDRRVAGAQCGKLQDADLDDPDQFDLDQPFGFKEQSKGARRPIASESSTQSLSFRLSRAPERCWTVYPRSIAEQHFRRKAEEEEEEEEGPLTDHRPLNFGICDYQGSSDFSEKNYSSGTRLLAVFSDGSAQLLYPAPEMKLYYPSGFLAIVVMVTEDNGRVCVVYDDDSGVPTESTRAVFHSDGRAMCYHSNKNIWLNLNKSAGRCLERDGSRLRQWTWSGGGRTPTALDPVRLPLNERVEVQVLGREQVFISFQACGEEVKLSVGRCSF